MMKQQLNMSQKSEGKPQTVYADAQFFLDKKDFLNIRVPRGVVDDAGGDCQILIRKHRNYFLKLFGLPFKSIKTGHK